MKGILFAWTMSNALRPSSIDSCVMLNGLVHDCQLKMFLLERPLEEKRDENIP
jgi:hypothetical protein